jgi:transcriptional regulator with XRE-family HTH domain
VPLAAAVTEQVRERMRARGWSQTKLARASGIAPTLVHRIMAGERAFTLDELAAVAGALRTTPDRLIHLARTRIPPDE